MPTHQGSLKGRSQLGNTRLQLQKSWKGGLVSGTEVVVSRFPLRKFGRVSLRMEDGKPESVNRSVVMRTRDVFGRKYSVRGLGLRR